METEAFRSAVNIYEQFAGKYPEILLKRKFEINDFRFYYYDYENIVSNSGKRVITLCKDLPNDKFYTHNNGLELFWEFNPHNGDDKYTLYKLSEYCKHKLKDIFWCKKFGFLQKRGDNVYKILVVEEDPVRTPGKYVAPYNYDKYVNLKIYLSRFDKKKLIKQ